jgi:hypothetical protein
VLAGFEAAVHVTTDPDTVAPALLALDFEPDTIDVSADTGIVIATITASDSLSGVSSVSLVIRAPTTGQSFGTGGSIASSGTPHNGVWELELTIPEFAEPGEWQVVNVSLHDAVGNEINLDASELDSLGYEVGVEVESSNPDTTPPVLVAVSLEPDTVSVAADSADIIAQVTVTDDLSGVENIFLHIRSPSSGQTYGINVHAPTTGTRLDGVWQTTLIIPRFGEPGEWLLTFGAHDEAGNEVNLDNAELELAGFENGVVVE